MGDIEKSVAREVRRSKIQRAVLLSIAATGVLAVAMVAPNAVQMLTLFEKNIRRKTDPKYAANRAFWRLVEREYITLEKTPHGTVARVTHRGEKILDLLERPGAKLKKPKRWDKKWRILIFDIREERRLVRDKLRATLEQLGFVCLQRSVWVYPYDCEDLIALLKADFKIGKDVLYIVADRIEYDDRLKRHFGLAQLYV